MGDLLPPTLRVLLSCGCGDDLPDEDIGHPWQIGEATLCDCTPDGLVYLIEFLPEAIAAGDERGEK